MRKCPICELNWVRDDETCCAVCNPDIKLKKIKKLTRNVDLGTNSKEIYERLCFDLNWDKSQVENFGYRKPLFARKADTERKRDVWFIFHSNLNENSVADNGNYLNIIRETQGVIAEYNEHSRRDVFPLSDRIVFAKKKDGGYKFLGVYKAQEPFSRDQGRLFIRISEVYPME